MGSSFSSRLIFKLIEICFLFQRKDERTGTNDPNRHGDRWRTDGLRHCSSKCSARRSRRNVVPFRFDQVAAASNHRVVLVDQKQEFLDHSLNIIQTSLKRIAKKKFADERDKAEQYLHDVQSRIRTTTDVKDAVKSTDIVIEAIVENLEIKQKLFKEIDEVAPACVSSSSSSSRLAIVSF